MKLGKHKAKENLTKLIEKFEKENRAGRINDYNEEATKTGFIQPFLKNVLGWNVSNRDEVSPEERISRGRVDYGLKIQGQTKLFIEVKPPRADLDKHIKQAVGYGYNRKSVPFVLLTDFEGLKLFDVTIKPDARNPLKGLKIDLDWKEYLAKFDKIWLLSKESVLNGELDKLLLKKPKDRLPVDKAILDDLKGWREKLAKDIFRNNPNLFHSPPPSLPPRVGEEKACPACPERRRGELVSVGGGADYLKEITQRIIDRIMFMRSCEDRKLIHRRSLKDLFEERTETVGTNTMVFLGEEFKHYNIIFDSDLFRPQNWETNLAIDFKVMKDIILDTYNPYQFDVIPLEVLGNMYEQYLGYTIRLTDHQVKYELKPDVRKAGGVYYTPEYIVDYIVKNTVGKLLKELPANRFLSFRTKRGISSKTKKLRILDPACGSGSFLIRAYEEMLRFYRNQKKKKCHAELVSASHKTLKQVQSDRLDKGEGDNSGVQRVLSLPDGDIGPVLTIEEKSQILQEHIFGVDIDEQAVEVTKLSLMLKMLEGEFGIIPGRSILPMLDKNIRCGNSLISGDTLELKKYFGDDWYKVKAFNWKDAFRKIMVDEGGFDVVIGNPPWVDIKGLDPNLVNYCFSHYMTTSNRMNIFAVFTEKSLHLLKKGGYFGYIVPNSILFQSSYEKLRQMVLDKYAIKNIARMPDSVFKNVKAESVILILYRILQPKKFKNEIVIFARDTKLTSFDYEKALEMKSIDQNLWYTEKYYAFNIFTSQDKINILCKIDVIAKPLLDFCEFTLGITPYDKYKGHTQKQIADKIFHANRKKDKTYKPLLAGGDVSRYFLQWNGEKWLKYGSWLGAPREERFFIQNRILVRQIVSGRPLRIFATITSNEYCNTQTIFNIIPKKTTLVDTRYILAILNSKMMNFYHTQRYLDKSKTLFQKILIQNAKQFPIRAIDFANSIEKKLHDNLVALVDVMLDLNKKIQIAKGSRKAQIQRQIEKTDREIDDLVYKLYGITEKERTIIEAAK